MNKGVIAGVLLGVAGFAAGMYYGGAAGPAPVYTSSSSGKSYEGGFSAGGEQAEQAAAAISSGNIKAVAGPATDVVIVVKDGDAVSQIARYPEAAVDEAVGVASADEVTDDATDDVAEEVGDRGGAALAVFVSHLERLA